MPKMIEMPHFTVLWLFGFHALLVFCLGACSLKLHFDLIEHLLLCHCLSFHLNALEAPNPKGASGREWCYVEPQVELGLFLARP